MKKFKLCANPQWEKDFATGEIDKPVWGVYVVSTVAEWESRKAGAWIASENTLVEAFSIAKCFAENGAFAVVLVDNNNGVRGYWNLMVARQIIKAANLIPPYQVGRG